MKWVNMDEVFPSACHGCSLEKEDKTMFGSDALIDECEMCHDREDYRLMSVGFGQKHDAVNETFINHESPHRDPIEVSYEGNEHYTY